MKKKLVIALGCGAIALLVLLAAVAAALLTGGNGNTYASKLEAGYRFLEQGDYDSAIMMFNEARAMDEGSMDAYYGLYQAYVRCGQNQNALAALNTGVMSTNDPQLQSLLAQIDPGTNPGLLPEVETTDPAQQTQSDSGNQEEQQSGTVSLNTALLDFVSRADFEDYSNRYGYTSGTAQGTEYSVYLSGLPGTLYFKADSSVINPETAMPYANQRPSRVTLDDATDLFGTEITFAQIQNMSGIRFPNISGTTITFYYNDCLVTLQCDGQTRVTADSFNSLTPVTVGETQATEPPTTPAPTEPPTTPAPTEPPTTPAPTAAPTAPPTEPPTTPPTEPRVYRVVVKVTDSTTGTALSGANVKVYAGAQASGSAVSEGTSGADGSYTAQVSNAGEYTVTVSMDGYEDFSCTFTIAATDGGMTVNARLVSTEPQGVPQDLIFTVVDATNNEPVSGVSVRVKHSGQEVGRGTTDATGKVTITVTQDGIFTVTFTKEGYIDDEIEVESNALVEGGLEIPVQLSPVMQSDQIRLVLSWGENPRDLDSHLRGTGPDGTSTHVYYGRKSNTDNSGNKIADLDVDDTSSYGPETTTIYQTNGTYDFIVERYSGTGTISESGAVVKIYVGDSLYATVEVGEGVGDDWHVCTIVNGQVTVTNRAA